MTIERCGWRKSKWLLISGLLLICWGGKNLAAAVVDFEDLSLAPNSYHNGDPGTGVLGNYDGSFSSNGAMFNNEFSIENFGTDDEPIIAKFWGGWAYSNTTDVVDPGVNAEGQIVNESSAYNLPNGGGAGNGTTTLTSPNYGVAFYDPFGFSPIPTVTLPSGQRPLSMQITNTTYAALSMLNGDGFTNKFATGDYLMLQVTGLNDQGVLTGLPVDYYLADYREINGAPDSLVSQWTNVDLSQLGNATHLQFALFSSQDGVPTYFAMDNLALGAASAWNKGDFNLDGHVDAADIKAMLAALTDLGGYENGGNSQGATLSAAEMLSIGDLNGDGVINNADLQGLLNLLLAGGGSMENVPEPASWVLASCGAICGLAFWRRGCVRRDWVGSSA